MPLALIALALGGFGIGLTEFVIAGLMPEVATDFAVSEPVAGYLISGYALSVAVGAIVVTAMVTRFSRKRVLLGLMVLFIIGNLMCAVAPTYGFMLAGRIVAALCHGAFFGIGSVVAASLVSADKRASAIAIMFAGLTFANVLGVPLGTLLGQQLGWRSTFWAITAIGIVAMIGIAALVPEIGRDNNSRLIAEVGAFRHPQVWMSMLITILGFGGVFGAFTYIAFTLTDVSGFASSTVPWLLILFGVGSLVGNLLGAKAADRALTATLIGVLAALTVVLLAFSLTTHYKPAVIAALFLMGVFGFATVPGLQMRIMNYAPGAPTLASGANIAAFNIGNAFGAWLGGLTIAAGFGFTSPIWVGAAVTAAGLLALLGAAALERSVRTDSIAPQQVPVPIRS